MDEEIVRAVQAQLRKESKSIPRTRRAPHGLGLRIRATSIVGKGMIWDSLHGE